jgi:hypothetical protein
MSRVFISIETIQDHPNNPIPDQYLVIPLNFGNISTELSHKIADAFSSDLENMFKRINHKTIIVVHEDSIDDIIIKE